MKMSEKRALVQKKQEAAGKNSKVSKTKEPKSKISKPKEPKAKMAGGAKKRGTANAPLAHDILQIFPDARVFETNLTAKFKERVVWQRPDPQEIKSIIPGVVTSLNIKEGDHVEEGELLLTFEAMKMQNLVAAPFAGTVEKIFVKEGEKTPKGVVMLYLKWDQEIVEDIEDPLTSGDLGLIV